MQRYMKGMSNGGAISARDGEILSNVELQAAVPSLFATEAHESRSARFVPIPTVEVLNGLRRADFQPVFAQQARTRIPGKQNFTRHMLRLRHASLTNAEGRAFEIILINGNDGTAAYQMLAGVWRFVCANGLFTGETFDKVHVRHTGKTVIEQVVEGATNILNHAPEVMAITDEMRRTAVTRDDAEGFARAAHLLRFARTYDEQDDGTLTLNPERAPVQPIDLLRARRSADKHPTAWHLFNIVQENAVKGGQRGHILGTNGRVRRQTTRAVNGIGDAEKLNRNLWDLAQAMVKGKRAA